MGDLAVDYMAARFSDFEPANIMHRLRRSADRAFDGIFDARRAASHDVNDLVHGVRHVAPSSIVVQYGIQRLNAATVAFKEWKSGGSSFPHYDSRTSIVEWENLLRGQFAGEISG